MGRLYSNENFPLQAVGKLRELGHDVLTSYESGKANRSIPDEEVLAFAAHDGRILITLNRKHFIRLHNENSQHTGIIVCTIDSNFEALAQRIHEVLRTQPDMQNRLVRVNRPNETKP